MDRLSALDALWLDAEASGPPIAIGSVAVLDGPAMSVDEVREHLRGRLVLLPRFRQRLQPDPLTLRHAAWVDCEPDLDHHVRARRVGPRRLDLDHAVSAIMERPLDRDRPLWDLHVLRGLDDDRWALVWRMHHAVADGEGASMLLGNLYDLRRSGGPTMTEALRQAPARSTADSGGSSPVGIVADTAKALPRTARTMLDLTPRTPSDLTGEVSPERAWRSAQVPLADARSAGKALGATVNDIVVTAVTTGFRDLLLGRGLDPERSLRAVVPVSLRTPGDDHADNQVAMISAELPVSVADVADRLAAVRDSTGRGKSSAVPQLMGAFWSVVDRLVPAGLQERVVERATPLSRAFVDTLITNVPGPAFPLFFAGHRAHASYPIIPVDGALRVTVGVVSYDGMLNLGMTADAANVPDLEVLVAGTRRGFEELQVLAEG